MLLDLPTHIYVERETTERLLEEFIRRGDAVGDTVRADCSGCRQKVLMIPRATSL